MELSEKVGNTRKSTYFHVTKMGFNNCCDWLFSIDYRDDYYVATSLGRKITPGIAVVIAGITLTILQVIGFFAAGIFQGIIAQLLVKNAFAIKEQPALVTRSQFPHKRDLLL